MTASDDLASAFNAVLPIVIIGAVASAIFRREDRRDRHREPLRSRDHTKVFGRHEKPMFRR